jgi:hypothetical protein
MSLTSLPPVFETENLSCSKLINIFIPKEVNIMNEMKDTKNQSSMGLTMLGLGAALGAAAVILSDEDKRNQTLNMIKDWQQKMVNKGQQLTHKTSEIVDKAEENLNDTGVILPKESKKRNI